MADYISSYSGSEIDGAVGKTRGITKNAPEINELLDYTETNKGNISDMEAGEVPVKKSDGTLDSSGIIDNGNNIFFPKTGRFPSGSIDIGPAITLSENGGWVQNTSETLGNTYLMVDYEIAKTGTTKPVYWERLAEEEGVIIQPDKTINMNINTFDHIPSTDSQVNEIYFDLTNGDTNLLIEIVSLETNEVIKYIPDEKEWQNFRRGKPYQGLNLPAGESGVLGDTPFSALQVYNLRFNFNKYIDIKGDGTEPFIKVDRQLINKKNILTEGDGIGIDKFTELTDCPATYVGAANQLVAVKSNEEGLEFINAPDEETPQQIRNKLQTLTGDERLDASAIKNIPENEETAEEIRDKLQTLTGENRLDASSIKDLPSGTFIGLDDTFNEYTSRAKTKLIVNDTETGIDSIKDYQTEILGQIVNEYDPAEIYEIGDLVSYEESLKTCISNTTGNFDPNSWENTSIKVINEKISSLENDIKTISQSYDSFSYNMKTIADRDGITNGQVLTQEQTDEALKYLGLGAVSDRNLPKFFSRQFYDGILYDEGDADPGQGNANVFGIKIPAKSLTQNNILRIMCQDFGTTGERYIKVYLGEATSGGTELEQAYGNNSGQVLHEIGYKIPEESSDVYIYLARQYLVEIKTDLVSSEFIARNLEAAPDDARLQYTAIDFPEYTQAIYVSNSGSDVHNGRNPLFAKQTLASAITAAYALPDTSNRSIICLDSSVFNENLNINQPVNIYMPEATVNGNVNSIANIEVYMNINTIIGNIGIHSYNRFEFSNVEGDLNINGSNDGHSFIKVDHWKSGQVFTTIASGEVYIDITNNEAGLVFPDNITALKLEGFVEGIPLNRHHFDKNRYELQLHVSAEGELLYRNGTYEGNIQINKVENGEYNIAIGGHVFSQNNFFAIASPFTNNSQSHGNTFVGSVGTLGVNTFIGDTQTDLPFMVTFHWDQE